MTTTTAEKILLDQRRLRCIKLAFFGILLISLTYAIHVVDPLELIVEDQVSLREGSFLYKIFLKPPVDVILKIYIFNVTNSMEFLSGQDPKINVSEVGPYYFQEFLENKDPEFHDNGTFSYSPVRRIIGLHHRSVGDPSKDIIITPNLPLLGLSSAISEISAVAALGVGALAKSHNAQPFLNVTVHDYLWGYEDNLIKLASNLVPRTITFEKFGILDRLLDEGNNRVNMNLPKAVKNVRKKAAEKKLRKEMKKNNLMKSLIVSDQLSSSDSSEESNEVLTFRKLEKIHSREANDNDDPAFDPTVRDYSINNYNGNPGLSQWGYENPYVVKNKFHLKSSNNQCNTLRGAYDGTVFPKKISKNETFRIYRKTFCRTLPIKFRHEGVRNGIKAYWFSLDENAFNDDVDDPNSSCYCIKKCLKRGLGSIMPCYYNIPVAVSLPHFYKSDPSLLNDVNGLNPDPEKHDSIVIMQPRLGIPISAYSRIQLNLVVGDIKFNSKLKRFINMVIPALWMEATIERLTPKLDMFLYIFFNIMPYVQTTLLYTLLIIGISLLSTAILLACCVPKATKIEYNPKPSIRYSAINMFPYIRRGIEIYGEIDDDLEKANAKKLLESHGIIADQHIHNEKTYS